MANPLNKYLMQQQNPVQGQNDQMLGQGVNQQMLEGLHNMVNMINGVNNKDAVMQTLAGANPQMAEIMRLCNGKDAKEVFIQACRESGVDPQYALNVMAQIGIK